MKHDRRVVQVYDSGHVVRLSLHDSGDLILILLPPHLWPDLTGCVLAFEVQRLRSAVKSVICEKKPALQWCVPHRRRPLSPSLHLKKQCPLISCDCLLALPGEC